MTSVRFRTSLVVLGLGAACASQAVTIGLSSVGGYVDSGSTLPYTTELTETVLNQQGGYGPLSGLSAHFDVTNLTGPFPGAAFYTGTGGRLDFDFELSQFVTNGSNQSFIGTWEATGGTGTYAGAEGGGTFAIVIDDNTQDSYTTLRGNLQAAPEPASLAALGLGALMLARRRRKA